MTLWKGPVDDGITCSLLQRFICCRERFRLQVVEGLREEEDYPVAIEYGNLWHKAEEAHLRGEDWQESILKEYERQKRTYPSEHDLALVFESYELVRRQFPIALSFWKNKAMGPRGHKPIFAEKPFRIGVILPSGRTITLRGMMDHVYAIDWELWLQDHKTKGARNVDEKGLGATIKRDLQICFYLFALSKMLNGSTLLGLGLRGSDSINLPSPKKKGAWKLGGVLYNVIVRPLTEAYPIRQKKSETLQEFYDRCGQVVEDNPTNYFKRWQDVYKPKVHEEVLTRSIVPLLEQVLDWWEWIKWSQKDPWRIPDQYDEFPDTFANYPAIGVPGGGLHWQTPFGVYNALAGGRRGDYFEFLTTGRDGGLVNIPTLFPELES